MASLPDAVVPRHPPHPDTLMTTQLMTSQPPIEPGWSSDPAGGEEPRDSMEVYFECITTCSLEDGECITRCVEELREHH
jgi:hypothetical protein